MFVLSSCFKLFLFIGLVYGHFDKWKLVSRHLPNTIDEAIKQYFEGHTTVLHVRIHTREAAPWRPIMLNHLTGVLRNSTRLTFRITNENQSVRCNKYHQHNLWYVDSYDALSDILPYKTEHFGSYAGYYAIIMETPHRGARRYDNIRSILQRMYELQIIDVILITHEGKNRFSVYTYEVFRKNRCRTIQPRLVNKFESGRFRHAELFPKKFTNFHNCILRVASRNVDPFMKYEPTLNDSRVKAVGIEAQVLRTIADRLNFRVEFHTHPISSILSYDTKNESFLLLDRGEVDLLLGYHFYSVERLSHYEESLSYMHSPVVAIVKSASPDTRQIWMFEPFRTLTWLMVLALIAFAIVVLYACKLRCFCTTGVNRRGAYDANWLDVLGSILGQPRSIVTTTYFPRFAVMFWLIGFVMLNVIYQGKLSDSYHKPDTNIPRNLNELLDQNYSFLLRGKKAFSNWEENSRILSNNRRMVDTSNPNDLYETLIHVDGRVAALTNGIRVLYFIRSKQIEDVLKIVPESVQSLESCVYFPHHSFLVQPFNRVIALIRSAGLVRKWFNDVFFSLNVKIHSHPNRMEHGHYPKPLNLQKLKLVFLAFVAMQFIASLVFLVELAVFYLNRRQ